MAVFLCTLHGFQNTNQEIFQHTIALDNPSFAQEDSTDVAEHVWDAWATAFNTDFQALFPTTMIYQGAKAAAVLNLSTGELAAAGVHNATKAGTASATNVVPYQCAIAVSLTAGNRPNGTPIRGRFYLPAPVVGALTSGFVSSASRTTIVNRVKVFHDELDTFTPAYDPVVWSRSLANTTSITHIRVGSVVDTIRSRRNAFTENYTGVDT